MRYSLTVICLLAIIAGSQAQPAKTSTEFGSTENGLIYGDNTIRQLKHIVDSLNLKFKVCELNRRYTALPQATGHYVTLEGPLATKARQDLDAQLPFAEFQAKYPTAKTIKDLLVTRSVYRRERDTETVFSCQRFDINSDPRVDLTGDSAKYLSNLKGKWIYKYYGKKTYGEASLYAIYCLTEFETPLLPDRYARLVQYVDCLVDTTTGIYLEGAKYTGGIYRYLYEDSGSAKLMNVPRFMQFLHKEVPPGPQYPIKGSRAQTEAYFDAHKKWELRKAIYIRDTLAHQPAFRELLTAAFEEAKVIGNSLDELEEYVETYISPQASLALKRNRIVVGGCSQDQSPRYHAQAIARLSAETVNWETFLRAHLDIMNDRFERVSDGSYAWAKRETYIKELEVLDINVPDLMLGISLRVDNPAQHHYFGSINRLGRALAESQDTTRMEELMLNMIRDSELDSYNRILIYYLFINYAYHRNDKKVFPGLIARLNEAVKTLPGALAKQAHYVPAKR
ncbi:hypothetical protein [Paraflavitalea sp. CAU 1676]|uniref:hypothetical protein n=1 Tax=Paraflavitalea sp. CAU 1676 TaxID=3032598 RepID=UPI0023DBB3B6|nr:hypothetical protein [Paraflavitalea sp. CAU 1676]MDF2188164.1 hypothetical protein [Paraflavitalea sp. CAU 1676]